MKMPHHRFYIPTSRKPDIFGLKHLTILGNAGETEAERQKRITKVEAGVAAAFRAARNHLGEEQARQLFRRVMRRPKRGQGKVHALDRDARLLKAFDEADGESVAALARRLHAADTRLGSTPGAIAAQIRKLVVERRERARAAAIQSRYWRMSTRHDPPTILSRTIREK